MSAAHTPGPWRCDSYKFVRQVDAPQHVICRLPTQYNSANQRLIAAAPELLLALQSLMNLFEQHEQAAHTTSPVGDYARAAIAAATGATA